VAKIDRAFSMQMPLEKAQQLFVEDIAPEFHGVDEFVLCKEEPGRLEFSDCLVDPETRGANAWGAYSSLRRLMGRRVKVDFKPDGFGTRVVIRGHAEREMQKAIALLGEPGHWPEGRAEPA
jgi:hypothetical protein